MTAMETAIQEEALQRRYRSYPAYKDSGVEWLGEVPEHWGILPVKRLASLQSGTGITSDSISEDATYPVFGGNGVRGFSDSFNHEGYYSIIGRQGALCGNINYATGRFWASEHAVVVSPAKHCEVRWLGETLRAMNLNQYSTSAAQPGLSVEMINTLMAPCPPQKEQAAIATFLDRETARIDALVTKKQRLIELLQEQRTALITRSVTKGLDSSVPMKDSEVEWLGEVPEHWEVRRLKFLLTSPLKYGANEAAELDDPDLPRYVRITDIDERDGLRDETFKSLPVKVAEEYLLQEGDVLFARSGATAGKSFLYRRSWGACAYAGYLIRARLDTQQVLPDFVRYFTASTSYWQWLSAVFIQATIQNVSADKYASLLLPKPRYSEQRSISSFLDIETARIDALVYKVLKAIELLNDLRTAVISAAVTGKIDVREEVR